MEDVSTSWKWISHRRLTTWTRTVWCVPVATVFVIYTYFSTVPWCGPEHGEYSKRTRLKNVISLSLSHSLSLSAPSLHLKVLLESWPGYGQMFSYSESCPSCAVTSLTPGRGRQTATIKEIGARSIVSRQSRRAHDLSIAICWELFLLFSMS